MFCLVYIYFYLTLSLFSFQLFCSLSSLPLFGSKFITFNFLAVFVMIIKSLFYSFSNLLGHVIFGDRSNCGRCGSPNTVLRINAGCNTGCGTGNMF